MCARWVDEVGHPVEKPSSTHERKISKEVGVQKRISMPLGL